MTILSGFAGLTLCGKARALDVDDPGWVQVGTKGQNGWSTTWFIGDIQPVPNSADFTHSLKGISSDGDNYRHRLSEEGVSCTHQTVITLSFRTFINDGSVQTWEGKSRWSQTVPEPISEAAYDLICKPEQPRHRSDRWTRIAENVHIDLDTRTRDAENYAAWYGMDHFNNADGKQFLPVHVSTPAGENALIAAHIVVERFTAGYTKIYNSNDLCIFGDDTMPKDSNYVVDMTKKYVVQEHDNW